MAGDACDPGPPPPGSPGEPSLGFRTHDRVDWDPMGGASVYHVYRGDLGELRTTGTYTQDAATSAIADRFCFLSNAGLEDTFVPQTGQVVFYLVTSDDGLTEGGLGTSTGGEDRPNDNPCR